MVKISQNINSNSLYVAGGGTRCNYAYHFFYIMVALFPYWWFLFPNGCPVTDYFQFFGKLLFSSSKLVTPL